MGRMKKSYDDISKYQLERLIENHNPALLLGNGFSINFNESFKNTTVTEISESTKRKLQCFFKNHKFKADPLEEEWLVFSRKLNAIFREQLVLPVIDAMGAAVADKNFKDKLQIRQEWLSKFSSIFTTNYDLLLDWSFTSDHFSWPSPYFLHGKCNLYYQQGDKEYEHGWDVPYLEITNPDHRELIGQIRLKRIKASKEKEHFFEVMGGTYQEKIYHINRNKYLTYCLDTFRNIAAEHVVIYGCSFSPNDQHLWDILNELEGERTLYISYLDKSSRKNLLDNIEKYLYKYTYDDIKFFQANIF